MTCAGQLVYGSDERLDHLVNETRRLLKQAPRRPTYMETPGAREIPRGGRLAVDYREVVPSVVELRGGGRGVRVRRWRA